MLSTDKVIGTFVSSLALSVASKSHLLGKVENKDDTILQSDQFANTTILLPTLNEEWFVEKTLQSIKNQNIYQLYPEKFEILVIDSDSEDNTVEIAKNYVDKIITMEERNLVKARTVAIENAKGDLIVFIDADTIYPANWLNSMLKHYYDDYQVIAVSGPEFHPGVHVLVDIYEPILIWLLAPLIQIIGRGTTNPMIGHNSSCYKWAFNMVNGFDVAFEYDTKSSKDTQIVLERFFTKKLKTVGKYIFDPQLTVYDYGGKRRLLYKNRKRFCNNDKLIEENKYVCRYWNEIENKIRF